MECPPELTFSELQAIYLVPNGWRVVDPQPQDFFGAHNRIYICKGEYEFPFQFKEKYKYLQIVHLFRDLNIENLPDGYKDYYEFKKSQKGTMYKLDIDNEDEHGKSVHDK